jgi:hypothetical protein
LHFYSIEDQRSAERTYKMGIDDEQAQDLVRDHLAEVKNEIDYVRDKLNSHGDQILKKWSKRSWDKRGKLLSDAAGVIFGPWPEDLPVQPSKQRRPCKQELGDGISHAIHRLVTKSTVCSGWKFGPWLEFTELTKDKFKLFALLHLRTTYSAQDWLVFDTCQNFDMWETPMGLGPYNPLCVQICGSDFGRLVPFDPDLAHARAMIGFPRAYITILAQATLARALRDIVDAIVMDAAATGNSRWSEMLNGTHGLYESSGEGSWSPYAHPGYTPPIGLDINASLQVSRGKLNQLVDEIEIMQPDPQYFYNYVTTLKAGINWDENVSTELKWAYVSEALLRNRPLSLVLWQTLINECRSFLTACRTHEGYNGSAIQPGSHMPPSIRDAYVRLRKTLQDHQVVNTLELGNALSDMDAMKDQYRKISVNGKLRNVVKRETSRRSSPPSDGIMLVLRMLENTAMHSSCMYGTKKQIDLLAEELSAAQFDERVDDSLSNLTVVDAMRMSLFWGCQAIVEPANHDAGPTVGNTNGSHSLCKRDRSVGALDSGISAVNQLENIMRNLRAESDSVGRRLGSLLHEFCNNPWPKSGSGPIWLEKATKSRQLLSTFWQAMRVEWTAYAEQQSDGISRETIIANVSFDLSPSYLAVVAAERKLHGTDSQRGQAADFASTLKETAISAHLLQSTWGCPTTPTDPVRRKRTKAKLARTLMEELSEPAVNASGNQQRESALKDSVSQDAKVQRIAVKQESLSVFNKMFSSGGTTSIRWIQLVQALTDAGMTATQVPGSGVKFANDRESIVFHKPHPEPVVDGVMLRCQIGRRLKKWFFWDNETFVLRVKNAEEKKADVRIE